MRLKATFPNAHNTLWPGQFVNARVLVRTEHDALTMPAAAVQRGPDGLFTYVVQGRFDRRGARRSRSARRATA